MPSPNSADFTLLLSAWHDGDQEAGTRIVNLVYDDLRRLAQSYLRHEKKGISLQATALVHEAYLRLFGEESVELKTRSHFYVIAARQMRRILIDHARAAQSRKRNGGEKVTLEQVADVARQGNEDLMALDAALQRLEKLYPRASQVVELRYFIGLTLEETARTLETSLSEVKRDWKFAKAWLYQQIS